MFDAKRLHPIAIVLNALNILKGSILPFIVLVVFPGKNSFSGDYFGLIVTGIYLVASVIFGALSWFKFTYRVEDDEIRIDQGIFIKKKRYIRLERIQSIDVTEGILQRLFSLVKVTIDTAGSSNNKAEAVLTAIPKQEAQIFQALLKEAKKERVNVIEDESDARVSLEESVLDESKAATVLFQMSFKELFLMAATSGGVGVVVSGAVALLSQLGDQIEYDRIYSEIEAMVTVVSWILIAVLVVCGLLLAYLIATIGIVLKYAFFTVKKSGEELIITRGLLEKRQLTIPIERIQAIRIVENLIRQPLGYATVFVETASGSAEDTENAKVMLFPLIKSSRLKLLLEMVTDDYIVDVPMNHVPKRALRRYIFRGWIWVIPLSAAAIYFLQPWGYISILLFVLVTIRSYAAYKVASWNIMNEQLTFIYRIFSKQTYVVQKRRIQSLTTRQSWFQRRKQLGTIMAFSKTGLGPSTGTVSDLEKEDVQKIKSWFQNSL